MLRPIYFFAIFRESTRGFSRKTFFMSYIRQIEPGEAQGELKAIYEQLMAARNGRISPVMQVFSLNPPLLGKVKELNSVITFGGSSLGRRREEMIATLVSSINGCHY